jgi:hypothetical protein
MKAIPKLGLILALACMFTFGVAAPGSAQSRFGALISNRMAQVERGFFRLVGRKDNVHKMSVKAGQNIAVMVNGDGSTNLDVWVYDTDGDLVDSGEGVDDQEKVRFEAEQTGTYTIRVSNLGQEINTYQLSF